MRGISVGVKRFGAAVPAWLYARSKRSRYVVAGALAILLLTQLLYPTSYTLPFTSIGGERSMPINQDGLGQRLQQRYSEQTIEVISDGVKTESKLGEAGLTPDATAAHAQAAEYPWWQRLIPFSLFIKPVFTEVDVTVQPDGDASRDFIEKVAVSCALQPQNAQLKINGTDVELTSAKPGRRCDPEQIKAALVLIVPNRGMRADVPFETLQPERNDESVKPLFEQAKNISETTYVFSLNGEQRELPREVVTGWLKFTENIETGDITLGLQEDKITEFLLEQEKKIFIAPGTTTITVENGVETAREEGQSGRGLDKNAAARSIQSALLGDEPQTVFVASTVTLPAKIRFNRNYENNQAGLDQLLQDLVNEKGAYGIALTELSGQRRIASASGDRRFIMASTYKMYVAYAVLKRLEAGQMTWGQEIHNGKNLNQCFDEMIITSDNPCAVALGKLIGWKNIESMLRAIGMNNTHFNLPPSYDLYSTASDEALFLSKLERGELVNESSRERLISVMKRQVFRKGIPSGTSAVVADKVGFLYGLLHDAAIVYSPKGTYALVVMTDNSSWAEIADATRRIEALLNK